MPHKAVRKYQQDWLYFQSIKYKPDLVSRQGCPDLNSRWPREDPPEVASASAAAAGPTPPLSTVRNWSSLSWMHSFGLIFDQKDGMFSCVGRYRIHFACFRPTWQNYVVLSTILHTLDARSKYFQVTNLTSRPRGINTFHKATKLLTSVPDPYVFGSPGSGSTSRRYGSGSGCGSF
jgi:hypothetical protein